MKKSKSTKNKNLDKQIKNISPEAIESFERAMLKGKINFIKNSRLKYVYIVLVILFVLFAGSILKKYLDFPRQHKEASNFIFKEMENLQENRSNFDKRFSDTQAEIDRGKEEQKKMIEQMKEVDPRLR